MFLYVWEPSFNNHPYINISMRRWTTTQLTFEATNTGTLLFQSFKCPVNQARVHKLCLNEFINEFVIGIYIINSKFWCDFHFSRHPNYTSSTIFDSMPQKVFYSIPIRSQPRVMFEYRLSTGCSNKLDVHNYIVFMFHIWFVDKTNRQNVIHRLQDKYR